ncbi:MAG: DPP IV N-terminal domain-containing protein [Candidatus Poribacteria bacterium]|nr:DPP IV N-terminal domain-containing protein [Candidatus Poribacteria bacterium]
MKRVVFVAILAIVFYGCGDDEPAPSPDITGLKSDITALEADLDKKFEALQADIKGLQTSVAQDTSPPVIEGAKPIDFRDDTEIIQDQTGGLPPSGKPVGEPSQGVPAFGEGRIVFTLKDGIYIMGSNGADKKLVILPKVPSRSPTLSPNGDWIAYTLFGDPITGGGDTTKIYIRHIENGGEFRVMSEDNAYNPAWSADGERIAYDDNADLYISTVDMANPQVFKITHGGSHSTNPTWSPDGRQIAFHSTLDGNYNIFAINTDGTNRIRLTNDAADDERPDWSPDGRQIAFMSHRHGHWDIYLVDTQTFVETQLTDSQGSSMDPSWSADGTRIAFNKDGDIYVMNADGSDLTNITNSPEHHEESPDW